MSNISNLAEAREARRLQQPHQSSGKGYALLHRKIMDVPFYKDAEAAHLWVHLILKAKHTPEYVMTDAGEILVGRGKLLGGRNSLAFETGLKPDRVQYLLRKFKKLGMIDWVSHGKFSVFSVEKYDDYQSNFVPADYQQITTSKPAIPMPASNTVPADYQQITTDKEYNNIISNTDVLESTVADKKSDKKKPSVSCQDVVDAYHEILPETAMERYAINRMTEATELLYSRNGMTATQKYEAIQSIFTQLTDHAKTGSRRGLRSFGEVMEDWVSDLEKRFDPSGEQRGMSTGIPSLDRMLSPKGLVKGSLFVIGARPKMGKTTLYSQMAINCAVHEKKPALMFSLEMPGDQILEKLVGQKSGVNPNIFYLPATNDADDGYQGDYDGDFNRAIETANRLSEIDLLYIDDTPGLSLAQIVSESRRIKREKGCVGMILVDYSNFHYAGSSTCAQG